MQEARLSGDEFINVPWLTDNEDEEWQEARKQNKLLKSQFGGRFEWEEETSLVLFDPTQGVVKGHSDSIDSDDNVSFVTSSDNSEVDEARRRRSQHKTFDDTFLIPEFEIELRRNIEDINKLNLVAKEYLMQYDPKHWCKTFFDTHSKCDAIDNNMCETFNECILDARQKAALSLLEDLRWKCSKRIIAKQAFVDKSFVGEFGPKVWEKIEERRVAMSRVWQLNGIPCKHAMLAIQHREKNFEYYVHPCYKRQAYINTYKNCIIPLDGMERWEELGMPSLDPPVQRKTTGRLKKKRHLEDWEISNGFNISRKGTSHGHQVQVHGNKGKAVDGNKGKAIQTPKKPGQKSKRILSVPRKKSRVIAKAPVESAVHAPASNLHELFNIESVSIQKAIRNSQPQSQYGNKSSYRQQQASKQREVVTYQQLKARLRVMEQGRLDEMELADWGALIQAMGSSGDGNNCP
ncbi:hypothetical protein SLEP1_g16796 [Rubroshorea leprosula]|uniref:Zinc finger PMZ-type domain-containing protein n=1 Tax=Rubroshorea leprosula TaxID=152421 RepID=A0AAV5J1A6_9ROSI|nr:hypothetical protein SLEP1_g16796 [Rubroshorea leprosula]